jgi:hypothetical protein
MHRSLVVLSVLGAVAVAVRCRHHAPERKAELAVAILKDVAELWVSSAAASTRSSVRARSMAFPSSGSAPVDPLDAVNQVRPDVESSPRAGKPRQVAYEGHKYGHARTAYDWL